MLDEDFFAFGLSIPHRLKVQDRTCKLVLRELARRKLPAEVAQKPKWGFAIPVDTWVGDDFKTRLRDVLLGPTSRLPEFFNAAIYSPMVEAFCTGQSYPNVSRQGLYQRVIMLLSLQLALTERCHSSTAA
jgi:asparagine synthase (glutamine-hydrolysing)